MKKIFVCAEIGINHNGDIDICNQLIDIAKNAGCDAVKFQKRDIDLVYTQSYLDSPRESPWGNIQRDQKKGLEFGQNEYEQIDEYCRKNDILWYASAWDINSQNFLKQFDCKFNKIASAMNVDLDFLEKVASEKKHTFISTGMNDLDGIKKAVDVFKKNNCSFELMHTISIYPMRDEDANLNLINTLRKKFNCDVGYSGHETGIAISLAAASLGATSIERHITLDRSMYGSDQSASLEPAGLRQLVGGIRKIVSALGDGEKKFSDEEKKVALKLREHLL